MIKVKGYKSRLIKVDNSESGKPSYRLEIPFSNALITMNVNNASDTEVLAFANTIPLDKIGKLIQ